MRHWISLSSLTLICTVPFATYVRAQESDQPTQATITVHDVESNRLIDLASGRVEATLVEVELTDPGVARSEDMEILGRLLQSALGEQYRWTPSVVSAHPHWSQGTRQAAEIGTLEGVYVDAYGIVFTCSAPPLRKATTKRPVDAEFQIEEIDDWERARRLLQGEQVAEYLAAGEKNQCSDCHTREALGHDGTKNDFLITQMSSASDTRPHPSPTHEQLTDAVVGILAEHGHRFRDLRVSDRVTIALTFREPAKRARGRADAAGAFSSLGRLVNQDRKGVSAQAIQLSGLGLASGDELISGLIVDQSSPGDLHLRQGNYDKAVKEYTKSLNKVVDGDPYAQKETGGDKATSLYKKLIQAHVGAGEYDRAQKLLELVERSGKKEFTGRISIVASGEDRQLPLPGRLFISVNKATLDRVASGQLNLHEFHQACKIRYSEPRPAASSGRSSADADPAPTAVPRRR